jgi:hypothetical protein
MTGPLPVEVLETRAAEERRRLHQSVNELRGAVREKLDVRRTVHDNFAVVAGAVAVVGLMAGFAFTGMFTRD